MSFIFGLRRRRRLTSKVSSGSLRSTLYRQHETTSPGLSAASQRAFRSFLVPLVALIVGGTAVAALHYLPDLTDVPFERLLTRAEGASCGSAHRADPA
ncbi:MAG: hypothetical protein AAGA81_18015 [Acidobacteriota bacterium]